MVPEVNQLSSSFFFQEAAHDRVITWAIQGVCLVILVPFDHEDNNGGEIS